MVDIQRGVPRQFMVNAFIYMVFSWVLMFVRKWKKK